MMRIMYPLQFIRQKSFGEEDPSMAIANSISMNTLIGDGGIKSKMTPIAGQQAMMQNEFRLNHDQQLFFEWGSIQFGEKSNILQFSSIGSGTLLGKPDAEGFSHGTVIWKIDGGQGVFKGATGAITSNFLVNLETDELIDNQFHVVYLAKFIN